MIALIRAIISKSHCSVITDLIDHNAFPIKRNRNPFLNLFPIIHWPINNINDAMYPIPIMLIQLPAPRLIMLCHEFGCA